MNTRAVFLLLFILGFLPVTQAKADYPFRVITENFGHFHRILAINEGPGPVAAKVEVTSDGNAASDRRWPAYVTVPAGQSLPLGRFFRARNNGQGYSIRTSVSYRIGDFNAAHAPDTVYRLPFADGLSFLVGQAFGGPVTSHTTPDSQHAVDITMPEGTLILAARAGTVVEVESSFTEGGKTDYLRSSANGVLVVHDDGTMGKYGHFTPGRQLVKSGQRVKAGTPLGYSGNTGYSSGPHLHFAVTRVAVSPVGAIEEESLPITFYAHNPPITFKPMAGTTVLADYTNPVSTLQARMSEQGNSQATGEATGRAKDTGNDALGQLKTWIEGAVENPLWLYGFAVVVVVFVLMLAGQRREKQMLRRQEPTIEQ